MDEALHVLKSYEEPMNSKLVELRLCPHIFCTFLLMGKS